jgi:hypothetical protein
MITKKKELLADKMTVREAITNPTGSGSANVGKRSVIIKDLETKFNTNILKKDIKLSFFSEGDNIVLLAEVPSESDTMEFSYDVVIRFIAPEDKDERGNLMNYTMQFCSNSPNFAFTYAYSIFHKGWMIDELEPMFSKMFYTDKPTVRNPVLEFGFEKSIYFTLLYLKFHKLLNLTRIEKRIEGKVTFAKFLKTGRLMTFELKFKKYNDLKKQLSATLKKAKATARLAKNKVISVRQQDIRQKRKNK